MCLSHGFIKNKPGKTTLPTNKEIMGTFFIGLFTIIVGALFVFAGYQFFRILMPIWGFVAGFTWGAQAVAIGLGTGFLATVTGWVIGFLVAIAAAALAYLFYEFAVALLGGSVGYWAVMALLSPLGMDGFIAMLLALTAGIALGFAVVYWKAPKGILIALSSVGGATAVIGGVLVMFGVVPAGILGTDIVRVIISYSFFWTLMWAALIGIGIISQIQLSQNIASVDTSDYYNLDDVAGTTSTNMAGVKGGTATKPEDTTKTTTTETKVTETEKKDEDETTN
jgi:hypothetical protein